MYAIDYDSLERARAKDRVKALRKVQHNAASACLDEIEAVNPDYYDQLVEAMHEPIGDEQRGRIVEYKLSAIPDGERGVGECSEATDHEDEPLDYCYQNGLLPELDGYYNLPDILGNAIYFKPTAAEVERAEHRRRYGITEGGNGIYDILFDKRGRAKGQGPRGAYKARKPKDEFASLKFGA
jgi:hypothetical protein